MLSLFPTYFTCSNPPYTIHRPSLSKSLEHFNLRIFSIEGFSIRVELTWQFINSVLEQLLWFWTAVLILWCSLGIPWQQRWRFSHLFFCIYYKLRGVFLLEHRLVNIHLYGCKDGRRLWILTGYPLLGDFPQHNWQAVSTSMTYPDNSFFFLGELCYFKVFSLR